MSFLSTVATPALQQVIEKPLFGGPYARLGKLFLVLGSWLFEQGGALGFGLRAEPGLLGRLLLQSRSPTASTDEASAYLEGLRDVAETLLGRAQGKEKS